MSPFGIGCWNDVITSETSGTRKNSARYRMPGSSRMSAILLLRRGACSCAVPVANALKATLGLLELRHQGAFALHRDGGRVGVRGKAGHLARLILEAEPVVDLPAHPHLGVLLDNGAESEVLREHDNGADARNGHEILRADT